MLGIDDFETLRRAIHLRSFVILALRKIGRAGLTAPRAAQCFGPLIVRLKEKWGRNRKISIA
jgi:hypothetical protein